MLIYHQSAKDQLIGNLQIMFEIMFEFMNYAAVFIITWLYWF